MTLYCDAELKALLARLGDELRFVTLTSEARLADLDAADDSALTSELEGLKVAVIASEEAKCARCWHQRPDVGRDEGHPELCGRCVENVAGDGEVRHYA